MAALSTSLTVKKDDELIYSAHLWWWNPYRLINHPLFTLRPDNSYSDWIAALTLKQFVDLNREQIEQIPRDDLYRHKEQIEEITAHIRSGNWENATLHVTLYEWESGLDW